MASVFLRLGCLSFGGPIAHLGYFRGELVEKRKWIDDAHYGDLVALCQFLPGPASSQVVFALGMQRAALPGALLASICFTLPSAVLMLLFAAGVSALGDPGRAGWLHGLQLAAVAVVAQAIWGMGKTLCPDRSRISLCLGSAALLLAAPGTTTQLSVLAAGALVGWLLFRRDPSETPVESHRGTARRRHLAAAAALLTFAVLLVSLPILVRRTGSHAVAQFDAFYRAGSLVFGGGHVVLPLLRAEVVPTGWLGDDRFLAGYGAAQALPGPMFAFAAYLGAAMDPGAHAIRSGVLCLVAIFLPAWLLIGGALPFWHSLRARPSARAALAGANAAVVGVLLAALYDPVMREAVRSRADVALVLVAFPLLTQWKVPAWVVVLGLAGAGWISR